MDHCKIMQEMGKRARPASHLMASAGSSLKRDALMMMARCCGRKSTGFNRPMRKTCWRQKRRTLRRRNWIAFA